MVDALPSAVGGAGGGGGGGGDDAKANGNGAHEVIMHARAHESRRARTHTRTLAGTPRQAHARTRSHAHTRTRSRSTWVQSIWPLPPCLFQNGGDDSSRPKGEPAEGGGEGGGAGLLTVLLSLSHLPPFSLLSLTSSPTHAHKCTLARNTKTQHVSRSLSRRRPRPLRLGYGTGLQALSAQPSISSGVAVQPPSL